MNEVVLQITKKRAAKLAAHFTTVDCTEHELTRNLEGYFDLIEKVKKVDLEAANYLCGEAIDLPNFKFYPSISSCFVWLRTLQGHEYWKAIATTLDQEV